MALRLVASKNYKMGVKNYKMGVEKLQNGCRNYLD